jgi:hypothetical protein
MSDVSTLDPLKRLDKAGFANLLDCSVSWIEKRMAEGMPHELVAGRVKFVPHRSESWLVEHGFIEQRGES